MSILTIPFLALVIVGAAVYYAVPKKWRWIELLTVSLVYYYYAGTPITILYLVSSTLIAWATTLWISYNRAQNPSKWQRAAFIVTLIAIGCNVGLWFLAKGKSFWGAPLRYFSGIVHIPGADRLLNHEFVGALGMGYVTLQIIGYIIDCYWQNEEPQKNPFKLFLFVCFFPQLTTGPISRYSNLKSIYEGNRLQFQNLTFGAQRILWGFTKKIVLAERLAVILPTLKAGPDTCIGFYSWISILVYPLQMYADFSGCMDIVLGVAEIFGIHLAENFRNPFFSRTSQEFWQRWHITLGTWAKDYVLYPLLKSRPMINLGKRTRKRFGKRAGKYIANLIGMLILWMVMGIWHGAPKYVVGVSLWYWIVLMLGDLLSPFFAKVLRKLHVKTTAFSWHLFQSARTYLIYAIGANFFVHGVRWGMFVLQEAFINTFAMEGHFNPEVLFNENLLKLGLSYSDYNVVFIMLILMIIVAILREKYGYARKWIAEQGVWFRWSIWIGLFVFVLIWGRYGPGYNASEFIYRGF